MLSNGTKVYISGFGIVLYAIILENKQIELKDKTLDIAHVKLKIGGEMDALYSQIFTDKTEAIKHSEKYEEGD